jgi:hypothetical protein
MRKNVGFRRASVGWGAELEDPVRLDEDVLHPRLPDETRPSVTSGTRDLWNVVRQDDDIGFERHGIGIA